MSGLPRGAGTRIDLAPFVELGWTVSFFTLYGQLGAHLQVVFDIERGTQRGGVAPLGVVGARFRLDRLFSLALEGALRVVATDSFATALHELPQLAVPFTIGISALFFVN